MINVENKHQHKEDEDFYMLMAQNKDLKSVKDDWDVDSGASRHFTNNIGCYADLCRG